jgi:hypothetical protein
MSKLVQQLRDKETEAKSIFAAMTSGDFTDEKVSAMQEKFDGLIEETVKIKENIEREQKLAQFVHQRTGTRRATRRDHLRQRQPSRVQVFGRGVHRVEGIQRFTEGR